MRIIIYRPLIVFLLSIALVTVCYAQPKCKIEHYSTEDGFSHDILTCMFKDSEGFMWFGSWDGINRFDGHKFVSFKSTPGDFSQITNNRIDQITEDKANHLWLKAYDGQVYRFDKSSGQFMPLSTILGLNEKTKIAFDRIVACYDNMLWLSTVSNGLICVPDTRFNSSTFIAYKKGFAEGLQLPSDDVNFFYKDKQKAIWLGTKSGLVCLEKNSQNVFRSHSIDAGKYTNLNFTAIAESDDRLFFTTSQGKLIIYDKLNHALSELIVSNSSLNSLLLNRKGNTLYITTSAGNLVTVNTTNLTILRAEYNRNIPLYSLYEDQKGNLWIEPDKQGVVRFDPITHIFNSYYQSNDSKSNYSGNRFKVFEDKNGTLWTIMKGGGFGYYDKAANTIAYFYNKPNSPEARFSNIVSASFYDPDGILWLYTAQRGIEKIIFQPNEFTQHLLMDPWMFLSDNEVRGLLCDRRNRVWVGTKSGLLYVINQGRPIKNLLINPPGGGIGSVYTFMQDNKGSVWLGTKANGLYRADPVDANETKYKLTHYGSDPNDHTTLSSNEIYAIKEDGKGRIWVGTFDGGLNLLLSKPSGVSFLRFSDQPAVYPKSFDKIRCMAIDKLGTIWLGTTNGLALLKETVNNQFKVYTYSKKPGDITSLGNNNIQFIYRDSYDRMWLATSGGGLNKAKGLDSNQLSFKVYSTNDGLPNDYLLSCTEDANRHLWVATQSGLSRFDPATGRFQNYNSYDGIPTNAAFSEASCQRTPDGQILFGSTRGYLSFDPMEIRDYPISAPMAFTNLQVNNMDIRTGQSGPLLEKGINDIPEIILNDHQNIFSIDYTVLDYRGSDKQNYLYKLDGFDTLWHDNQNQRRATYTNLPSGHYVFEVKCVNQELYKNTPTKKVAITILPSIWRTWWAYLLYMIVLVVILEVIRRNALSKIRLRQRIIIEQKLAELKIRFFTNISHELRTPLTLILNPLEAIDKQENLSAQGKQYLTVVRRNAKRMSRFINQLLDLRKVQSGKAKLNLSHVEVLTFVKEIGEYFNELAREKNIKFQVTSESSTIYGWFDSDKIETVLYNLIGNAYKFAPNGTEIKIHISSNLDHEEMTIEVNDQGQGVSPEELQNIFELYYEGGHGIGSQLKGTGIGLALCRELVVFHQGSIMASNNTDGGLSVAFTIPIGRAVHREADVEMAESTFFHPEFLEMETGEFSENSTVHSDHTTLPLVLLVEDNTDMRSFLKDQLSSVYHVEEAADGEKGLKKAVQLMPDLVISDIMMPKMNGIQLLEQLKNNEATSHIPIILLSAKSDVESQIEGMNYGADYYINKPFYTDFLLAAMANIITRRKNMINDLMQGKTTIELGPSEIFITSKDEIFLKKVIKIVEDKMADANFNIDTIATMVNMGRTSFFKKFKSLTQMTTVEFVREMRLKRAKQYFDAGSVNIADIAYTVGFNNPKYFSTCFKAKYHLSPSDFLKSKEIAESNDKDS